MPQTELQTELQRNLLGSPTRPQPARVARCVGGCGLDYPREQLTAVGVDLFCARCLPELFVECCECSKLLAIDDHNRPLHGVMHDCQPWCQSCITEHFSKCSECGRLTRRGEGNVCRHPSTGSDFCAECFHYYFLCCNGCGETFETHQIRHVANDQCLCPVCFEVDHTICLQCRESVRRSDLRDFRGTLCCQHCATRASTWAILPWTKAGPSYSEVGSFRKFGIELETACCDDYRSLSQTTEWGCVYECSTSGYEFVSPILCGDNGLDEVRDFCDVACRKGWETNSSCGLHVHLDLRDESSEECLRIAYAYRLAFQGLMHIVTRNRFENSMCGSPQYGLEDIRRSEHIEDFVEQRDRFEFVNWRAYLVHGSFEVRVYQGTLDAVEICNWVKLHAQFIDKVKHLSYGGLTARLPYEKMRQAEGFITCLESLLDDADLVAYWARRARRLASRRRPRTRAESETLSEGGRAFAINSSTWVSDPLPSFGL